MGKYQENWKHGKCERNVIEKYQENWKYGKFSKCEIGNMENVKKDNRNKRSIVGGGGANVKTQKGIQWNKYYYFAAFVGNFVSSAQDSEKLFIKRFVNWIV